jgi:DNA invertase Pin-like site-specific DNA recombinase
MPTWAGIVRVSFMGSRRAGAADFHADRDQVALIERAVPSGDRLELLPAELNVSGGLPLEQRPSLLAAVEGVERGLYAGIIVGYLSRLGRSVREQLRTYDRVHAAGGRIIVAQEGIDAHPRRTATAQHPRGDP